MATTAIKINTTLNLHGLVVPTGSMVIPCADIKAPILNLNSMNEWDGTVTHQIFFKLPLYASKLAYQQLNLPVGAVNDFEPNWLKTLTGEEYTALFDVNAPLTVVSWVLNWLELQLGPETCELIDPFIID